MPLYTLLLSLTILPHPWAPSQPFWKVWALHTDWRTPNNPGEAWECSVHGIAPILALCLWLFLREGCSGTFLLHQLPTAEKEEPEASITHIDDKGHQSKGWAKNATQLLFSPSYILQANLISGKSFGFIFASIPPLCFSFGPRELDQSVGSQLAFPLTGIWVGVLWVDEPVPQRINSGTSLEFSAAI